MSSKAYDPDREQALKAVEDYKRFNKETKEECVSYDRKLRIWTFKKTSIDANAGEMHKNKKTKNQEVQEKRNKKKMVKFRKSPSKPRVVRKDGQLRLPNPNSKYYIAYKYFSEGKSTEEISQLMETTKERVRDWLYKYTSNYGNSLEHSETKTVYNEDRIVELYNKLGVYNQVATTMRIHRDIVRRVVLKHQNKNES